MDELPARLGRNTQDDKATCLDGISVTTEQGTPSEGFVMVARGPENFLGSENFISGPQHLCTAFSSIRALSPERYER